MKTSPKALAAHRRLEKNIKGGIWFHILMAVVCSVTLMIALTREWHWFIRVMLGLGIASAVIGLLAAINALSDRKKIIAKIENAHE